MSWSGESTHFRVMRTINPKQGEAPWAVTKVRELKYGVSLNSSRVETVQDGITTEQRARDLRFKHMVNSGVFSW